MSEHLKHMQQAIDLARQGEGQTSPNPLVGCVIVRDHVVIGQGWHRAAGRPHAEIEAIRDAGDCRGATLYVTLEPCSHHGRTPPCIDAIAAAGITRVVFAVADPNPIAAGGGEQLRALGIDVLCGVGEAPARHMNRFWLHHQRTARPFVVVKYAASLDGRVATRTGHSKWITGPAARERGHELRQSVDALLVGAGTAISDNPRLTVRLPVNRLATHSIRHPLRVVLDSTGRIPPTHQLLQGRLPGHTLVLTTDRMSQNRFDLLTTQGNDVVRLPVQDASRPGISDVLQLLAERNVQSVLVEGGPTVLGAFFDAGYVDEVWAFLAPILIGGRAAPVALLGNGVETLQQAIRLQHTSIEQLGVDFLVHGCVESHRGSS